MKTATLIPCLLLLLLTACSRQEHAASSHSHAHRAPHGGVLVELGDHAANLEFKFDVTRGVLQVWVLDGHAEDFVRVSQLDFVVEAKNDTESKSLHFKAMGNSLTGETPGDTATFEAAAMWLAEAKAFDGRVKALTVRGSVYRDIPFKFSLPASHAH